MHDVLHSAPISVDVPEDWRLKHVAPETWASLWSPVYDIRTQQPRTPSAGHFMEGHVRGALAGARYATGWQLVSHPKHKLSARAGLVSVKRLQDGYATYDFELKSFVLRPGYIAITDHLLDFRGSHHEAVGETVYIPRSLLGLPTTSAIGPIVIPTDGLIGTTLSDELSLFFSDASAAPNLEGSENDTILHITSTVIGNHRHPVSERAGWWRARNEIIRKYIEANLGDQSLLPAKICSVFNLSRATLYRMFEADGGVRRYIQDRRLHAAIWDLANGDMHRGRLTQVSEKWGFSSNANFNRAVKAAFSVPPGALFNQRSFVRPTRLDPPTGTYPLFDWFKHQAQSLVEQRIGR